MGTIYLIQRFKSFERGLKKLVVGYLVVVAVASQGWSDHQDHISPVLPKGMLGQPVLQWNHPF